MKVKGDKSGSNRFNLAIQYSTFLSPETYLIYFKSIHMNSELNTIPDSFVEATKKATLLCFRSRENLARIFAVI